jgi:hypothetical protein
MSFIIQLPGFSMCFMRLPNKPGMGVLKYRGLLISEETDWLSAKGLPQLSWNHIRMQETAGPGSWGK